MDIENKTIETEKGNIVDVSDIVDGAKVTWWNITNDDGEAEVTNGFMIITVGDTIYYNAVTEATELSRTSKSSSNGNSDQTFELTKDSDYEWKVIGADEDTGELLIVLSYNENTGDNYIKTNGGTYYYLKGRTGYANCKTELDYICGLFGQGEGATGARSMTVEDVNSLTGYNPETAKYGNGAIIEYGNDVTYYWDGSDTPYYSATNNKSGNLSTSHSIFYWYDIDKKEWLTSACSDTAKSDSMQKIATLTGTYYSYASSAYPSSLVYTNSGYYWLSSVCIYCFNDSAYFRIFRIYQSGIIARGICYSYGGEISDSSGIRPVVSLSSDISLSGSSEDGWNINI